MDEGEKYLNPTNESSLNSQQTIVVLGAGPAGLACAHQLLVERPELKVVVLDRARVPGGAGASFSWKGHTLDYGPHAFHTRGDSPERLVRSLFEDSPEELVTGTKRVRVFLTGRFFKYPLRIREALLKFNPFLTVKIMLEFLMTTIIHQIVSIPVESFEDWGRKRFGSTLYRLSFGNYTKKVWKTDPNRISKRFASEKIQGFSFINLIKKLLRFGGQVTEPYYQTWIYPKKGSGVMFIKLADRIRQLGGEIVLQAQVNEAQVDDHKINNIKYRVDNEDYLIKADLVVNTLSLPVFIGLLGERAPFSVRQHASKLRYISLVLVYVEFAAEKIGKDNWFYLLDDEFLSNRVTEQKNISSFTMEPGKTVLSFELTCRDDDDFWKKSDEDIFDIVRNDCRKIPLLAEHIDAITDYTVRRAPKVYECYHKNFDAHAESVLGYVQKEVHNAVTIGRRGLFLQGDMHQSVEMGINMGSLLIKSIKKDAQVSDFVKLKRNYYAHYVKYIDDI